MLLSVHLVVFFVDFGNLVDIEVCRYVGLFEVSDCLRQRQRRRPPGSPERGGGGGAARGGYLTFLHISFICVFSFFLLFLREVIS